MRRARHKRVRLSARDGDQSFGRRSAYRTTAVNLPFHDNREIIEISTA
jgi:hypothetical protein